MDQSGFGFDFGDFSNLVQLGANTYLAQQAINSPRPATVAFAPNGQTSVVTGGGALPNVNSVLGTSSIWLLVFGFVLVLLLLRR